ncbi:MAG: hypothetical protein EBQ85_00780, partial [Proteobacteria bacterium]|nr:hypothetical protein [Pseudomonadota bacterium]
SIRFFQFGFVVMTRGPLHPQLKPNDPIEEFFSKAHKSGYVGGLCLKPLWGRMTAIWQRSQKSI